MSRYLSSIYYEQLETTSKQLRMNLKSSGEYFLINISDKKNIYCYLTGFLLFEISMFKN